jgi:LPXTG-motif cell wall-anchored protein
MTSNWLKQLPREFLLRGSVLAVVLSPGALAQSTGDAGQHHAVRANSGGRHDGGNGAPEIDAGLAAAGLVLLAGGTLVLTSRRRAKTA